jgi:hypothetical protein
MSNTSKTTAESLEIIKLEEKEKVLLLKASEPHLSYSALCRRLNEAFDIDLTESQVRYAVSQNREEIDRLKASPKELCDRMYESGYLRLYGPIARLRYLEQLGDMCMNGWEETVTTPTGEIVEVLRRDTRTALGVVESYRRELKELGGEKVGGDVTVNIQIVEDNNKAAIEVQAKVVSDDDAI